MFAKLASTRLPRIGVTMTGKEIRAMMLDRCGDGIRSS